MPSLERIRSSPEICRRGPLWSGFQGATLRGKTTEVRVRSRRHRWPTDLPRPNADLCPNFSVETRMNGNIGSSDVTIGLPFHGDNSAAFSLAVRSVFAQDS